MRQLLMTAAICVVTSAATAQDVGVAPMPYVSIQAQNLNYGRLLDSNVRGRTSPRAASGFSSQGFASPRSTSGIIGNTAYFRAAPSVAEGSVVFEYQPTTALARNIPLE